MSDEMVAEAAAETQAETQAETETAAAETTAETAAETTAETTEAEAPAPTWPEDWRDRFGGKDDKAKRILGRYSTPENVAKAYLSLRTQLDSGEIRRVVAPGENATPDEITAYRKSQGIPETPEGYAEGREFDENDKAVLGSFTALAHEKHLPKAAVDVAFDWYKGFMDETRAAQAEYDQQKHAEAEDALRAEWGPEYRSINNATTNLVKSAGLEGLLDARMADGTRLADSVEVRKWLSQMADAVNPALRVTGGGDSKSIDTELEQIAEQRKKNPDAYWKNEKLLARERELIAAQQKLAS